MKKSTRVLLAFLIILAGCRRDCLNSGNSTASKLYRVYTEGVLSQEYVYNTNGFLERQTFYVSPGKKSAETLYLYDSNRLVRTETFVDISSSTTGQQLVYSFTEYKYGSDGKLTEERVYSKDGSQSVLRSIVVPGYQNDGKVTSHVQLAPDNLPFSLSKYQYNKSGNIILQETYRYDAGLPVLGLRTVYEHDNKNNPYVNLSVVPFSVNKNNIIKSTTTNYNINPASPVTTTSTTLYKKYTADHFPLEVIEHGSVTYTYEYK